MTKYLLATALAVTLAAGTAHAVDFTFGAAVSSGFASNDGTDLAPGSLILFGTFDVDDSQLQAQGGDIPFLLSVFHQVSSATIGEGNPASGVDANDPVNAGLFNHAATGIDTTASGLNVAGQQLYYWVFNAATVGAATETGLFSSTSPSWIVPTGTGSSSGISLDTDIADLTTDSLGQSLTMTVLTPYYGGFGPGTNATGGGMDFRLGAITVAVPEPASVAMGLGLVGLTLAAWRRRR